MSVIRFKKQVSAGRFTICSLYDDRQLVINGFRTKFIKPLDITTNESSLKLYGFIGDDEFDVNPVDGIVFIGRNKNCSFRINEKSVSRQHCVIVYRWIKGVATPFVFDLNSKNQTYLNTDPVEHSKYVELKNNDVLKFGNSNASIVVLGKDSV